MKRYEYDMTAPEAEGACIVEHMNERGAEGWELSAVDVGVYYWRRETFTKPSDASGWPMGLEYMEEVISPAEWAEFGRLIQSKGGGPSIAAIKFLRTAGKLRLPDAKAAHDAWRQGARPSTSRYTDRGMR